MGIVAEMPRASAVRPLLLALPAVLLLGCSAVRELLRDPEDAVVPFLRPDPVYEEMVPRYLELCAVSQFRPIQGRLGGIPGHAVLYLKGACRDESAGYPRLRRCRRVSSDRADLEHGAGVSVNRWFRNVNWVATPSKALFYDGDLRTYEVLDRARLEETLDRALELGIFDGIQRHPVPGQPPDQPLRDFVRISSLGTDFALRFGRSVFCIRVPVKEQMLERAMDFLNDLNDEYYRGEADYEWSGYADNCVHTLHNALAAAGIWKPKSVRATKARQFFNLAVPANTFVDLAFLTNEYPIEDFGAIRGDPLRWKGLLEEKWLPAEPGALVKTLPVHQVNDLYDNKLRIFVLPGLLRNDTVKRAQRLLSDGRYLQIDANLRFFHDRYEAILARRDRRPGLFSRLFQPGEPGDREIYYDYLERARDEVLTLLQELQERDAARESAGPP